MNSECIVTQGNRLVNTKIKLFSDLAIKTATAKFDETIEVHVRLGVDSRHADQQVRGAVVLPNGTGKDVRVAVFAKGDLAKAAEEAGADIVGDSNFAVAVLIARSRASALSYKFERSTSLAPSVYFFPCFIINYLQWLIGFFLPHGEL